ncbi:SDR family NAD(P)-dependent oxidoreductase [Priestia megaterium]|uniref:Oxidoreductase, short-chain dehydrogenase/reductase family n=1 Tax=Priestia megaterium (strain DSM 319 / IMG 1521) TaxID=592022 RepID=D5DGW8_PRIM3|nr:SDR family oxidoreductase [Priestia megaterium]ADF39959.1 oxidoreductase, short-chain dehydrogenase/reductase family [Priestia megaterium DSM 319]MED3940672.1 SDR family NAD(P)-dependent oxidoreductase [Priestia megaterium]MED4214730.1 SDR family NAD(P)-dependent oxidoreductase [Priestia megaterium]WEZ39084.1 SDR family NAD(P)-dependent oxidoreductase [Priestia megaterium DSM 319]
MQQKRVAVITGGASGIGKETALKFAQKGDAVVIADYDKGKGKEALQKIEEAGGSALFVQTDVTKFEEVEALIEEAVNRFGRIDVMFNNAGIGHPTSILDQDLEEYHRIINVNQHGVTYGIMAAGRKMRELGIKGVIINTASIFSFLASPGTYAYHATKGAVVMMTKSAALDLAKYGIRVVAVAPGFVDTPIIQGYKDNGMIEGMKAKTMSRELTTPKQIADMVYLLSLEEAGAVNGSVIMADDGYAAFK